MKIFLRKKKNLTKKRKYERIKATKLELSRVGEFVIVYFTSTKRIKIMKRSTIATTALALAASVFAGSSFASVVTNTPVFEDFSALSGINNVTTNNLTWMMSGNDNESAVVGEALTIDTGDGKVTATINGDVTNNIAKAAARTDDSATFSASVSFYPATAAQTLDPGVKFALYALVDNNETNLVAQTQSGTTTIGQVTCGTPTTVTVNFPTATTFTVAIGNNAAVSGGSFSGEISAIDFQGNGTVDNIAISYTSTMNQGTSEQIGGGSHPLTDKEATYLNSIVAKAGDRAAVDAALASVNEATFEKASLLNVDVTASGASDAVASANFSITDIKRNGNNVTVKVKLVRNGTILGGVNGTVALYTCDTPNGTYQRVDTFGAVLTTDASEAEATKEFTGVTAPFFQVKIED